MPIETQILAIIPAAVNTFVKLFQTGYEFASVKPETAALLETVSQAKRDLRAAKEHVALLAKTCSEEDTAVYSGAIRDVESALKDLEVVLEPARLDTELNNGQLTLWTKLMWVVRESNQVLAKITRLQLAQARFEGQKIILSINHPTHTKDACRHASACCECERDRCSSNPPPSYIDAQKARKDDELKTSLNDLRRSYSKWSTGRRSPKPTENNTARSSLSVSSSSSRGVTAYNSSWTDDQTYAPFLSEDDGALAPSTGSMWNDNGSSVQRSASHSLHQSAQGRSSQIDHTDMYGPPSSPSNGSTFNGNGPPVQRSASQNLHQNSHNRYSQFSSTDMYGVPLQPSTDGILNDNGPTIQRSASHGFHQDTQQRRSQLSSTENYAALSPPLSSRILGDNGSPFQWSDIDRLHQNTQKRHSQLSQKEMYGAPPLPLNPSKFAAGAESFAELEGTIVAPVADSTKPVSVAAMPPSGPPGLPQTAAYSSVERPSGDPVYVSSFLPQTRPQDSQRPPTPPPKPSVFSTFAPRHHVVDGSTTGLRQSQTPSTEIPVPSKKHSGLVASKMAHKRTGRSMIMHAESPFAGHKDPVHVQWKVSGQMDAMSLHTKESRDSLQSRPESFNSAATTAPLSSYAVQPAIPPGRHRKRLVRPLSDPEVPRPEDTQQQEIRNVNKGKRTREEWQADQLERQMELLAVS